MPRLRLCLALASALSFLSACDSGETSTPDALVGTWSLQSANSELYVTVREAQLVPDLARPTVGAITFSGDVTGRLSEGGEFAPTERALTLRHLDAQAGPQSPRFTALYLDASTAALVVAYPDNRTAAYRSEVANPFTYDYRTGTVTVRALTLVNDAGRTVSVAAGSARFQGTAVPVGVETLAQTSAIPLDGLESGYLGDRITFAEDRSFRAVETYSDGSQHVTNGTWETTGGEVRLTVTDPDTAGMDTFEYSVRNGTLRLSRPITAGCTRDPDTSGCLVFAANSYGVKPGTLTGIASARAATFSRVQTARR